MKTAQTRRAPTRRLRPAFGTVANNTGAELAPEAHHPLSCLHRASSSPSLTCREPRLSGSVAQASYSPWCSEAKVYKSQDVSEEHAGTIAFHTQAPGFSVHRVLPPCLPLHWILACCLRRPTVSLTVSCSFVSLFLSFLFSSRHLAQHANGIACPPL